MYLCPEVTLVTTSTHRKPNRQNYHHSLLTKYENNSRFEERRRETLRKLFTHHCRYDVASSSIYTRAKVSHFHMEFPNMLVSFPDRNFKHVNSIPSDVRKCTALQDYVQ